MAEGILRETARSRRLQIETDSCGTSSWHLGHTADPRAIVNMKMHGIDISDLRSRPFDVTDFTNFDHIFVMDRQNLADVLALAQTQEARSKVKLFLDESEATKLKEVPDPYYGGDEGFENVFNLLNHATESFLNRLPTN
ncbi:MAG: protein-tyrosine phosphatase [Flavobacteriales bacterium]|jgi:protein-tyrosine phosphatase